MQKMMLFRHHFRIAVYFVCINLNSCTAKRIGLSGEVGTYRKPPIRLGASSVVIKFWLSLVFVPLFFKKWNALFTHHVSLFMKRIEVGDEVKDIVGYAF